MKQGLSIDQAAACVHFYFGISNNYFVESTKFKVFKALWTQIVSAYKPKNYCSNNVMITAVTGFVNKSLKDPYTNLLRQTTEAMSAINGGIDHLIILPYDLNSTNGSTDLSERMALNLSLIKRRKLLDSVISPTNGAYVENAIFEYL